MPFDRIVVEGVADVIAALAKLGPAAAKRILPAVKRGATVTLKALEAQTPVGPSGNLKRAAAIKMVKYGVSTAVAVVGYVRSGTGGSASGGGRVRLGKDRAFHQYWIEYGTKMRRLKKQTVASSLVSWGRSGSDYFASRGYGGKAGWSGAVVVFRPKDGNLGRVQPQEPMHKAFAATRSLAKAAITKELEQALNAATEEAKNGI